MSKIWDRYNKADKMSAEEYWEIHTKFLIPTEYLIDVNMLIESNIKQYALPWGTNRPELNDTRLGIPLINFDGKLNHNDISIGPLDHYNKLNPDTPLIETDFEEPTAILDLPCFDGIEPLKEYMIRSSLLYWKKGANFVPHVDAILPAINLRLWGTTQPDNIQLRYESNGEMVVCEDVEPGRLYLIETTTLHDAACVKDEAYQFFIAVTNDAKERLCLM